MLKALDPNGECPCCGVIWKEAVTGAISQVVRLYAGVQLRGFQCHRCASRFTVAGDLVSGPINMDEP